mgnify:CR=1 FL=1
MGGNLFKTERMGRQEYEEACLFISTALAPMNYAFTKSFLDKNSFGDIDILVSCTNFAKELLYKHGLILEVNGSSVLIQHKGKQIQIDLIQVDNMSYALNYYSYGMFCPIIGKIFKSQGFKLNPNGLYYIYNGNEVFITNNWHKILGVIGIYKSEFTREEEAFAAISKSPFFVKNIFTDIPEKKLAKAMKHPMYCRFLEYIKDVKDYQPSTEILNFFQSDKDFIRRLQCEDITAKANLVIKELMRNHYPYEDFKSRCQDLTDREVAHEYALFKGYLKTTIMAYFNDKSAQIQRPLTDNAELNMHIHYFGHRVYGVDFKYLPLENIAEYQGIQQCRVYQERYMNQEEKDS